MSPRPRHQHVRNVFPKRLVRLQVDHCRRLRPLLIRQELYPAHSNPPHLSIPNLPRTGFPVNSQPPHTSGSPASLLAGVSISPLRCGARAILAAHLAPDRSHQRARSTPANEVHWRPRCWPGAPIHPAGCMVAGTQDLIDSEPFTRPSATPARRSAAR